MAVRGMGRYREGWATAVTAMVVVGWFLACESWSVAGVLTVALSVAVFAWMVCAVLGAETAGMSKARQANWALLTGAVFVCVIGWIATIGTSALLVWSLLAVSSPLTLRWVRATLWRWCRYEISHLDDHANLLPAHAQPNPAPLTATVPEQVPAELSSLDVCELCWAWRRSFVTLQRATTVTERLKEVQLRQHLLDEFDRRSPDRLSAWLASGARAAGDPSRYIAGRYSTPPPSP